MATNFYLQLQNSGTAITGESTDSNHNNWIEVLSWSHSFNQPAKPTRSGTGGGTVEKANHSDFSITKYIDSATDDLLKACWSGQQFSTGTFEAYRSDGNNQPVQYLQVVMEDIIVSNVSFGGGGGDLPTETVGLSYGKVTYTYTPQVDATGMAGGAQPVSHDLTLNEVC
jgi:type VI secretion system secreted protein Hcp